MTSKEILSADGVEREEELDRIAMPCHALEGAAAARHGLPLQERGEGSAQVAFLAHGLQLTGKISS